MLAPLNGQQISTINAHREVYVLIQQILSWGGGLKFLTAFVTVQNAIIFF